MLFAICEPREGQPRLTFSNENHMTYAIEIQSMDIEQLSIANSIVKKVYDLSISAQTSRFEVRVESKKNLLLVFVILTPWLPLEAKCCGLF